MIGPIMRFRCPLCGAKPGKPCVRLTDKSKTTKMHDQRRAAFYRARSKDSLKVLWTNRVESNPRRH